jgi:hypothetical protein
VEFTERLDFLTKRAPLRGSICHGEMIEHMCDLSTWS